MRRDARNAHHIATISHDGRFWEAYLEIEEPTSPGEPVRGRLAFTAADDSLEEPVRTTTIFIERSPQEVLNRARDFKTHQIVALLRSSIPDEPDEAPPEPPRKAPDERDEAAHRDDRDDQSGPAPGS